MATALKTNPQNLPNYIVPIEGKRPKIVGKVKIPHYDELPKVRGIFRNLEVPGTGISIPLRFWKGPIMTFHLMDGEEYVIPRVVADHFNENCAYKEMKWVNPQGISTDAIPIASPGYGFKPIGEDFQKVVHKKTYRYMFQILGDA